MHWVLARASAQSSGDIHAIRVCSVLWCASSVLARPTAARAWSSGRPVSRAGWKAHRAAALAWWRACPAGWVESVCLVSPVASRLPVAGLAAFRCRVACPLRAGVVYVREAVDANPVAVALVAAVGGSMADGTRVGNPDSSRPTNKDSRNKVRRHNRLLGPSSSFSNRSSPIRSWNCRPSRRQRRPRQRK
jgi:hypothetical protein